LVPWRPCRCPNRHPSGVESEKNTPDCTAEYLFKKCSWTPFRKKKRNVLGRNGWLDGMVQWWFVEESLTVTSTGPCQWSAGDSEPRPPFGRSSRRTQGAEHFLLPRRSPVSLFISQLVSQSTALVAFDPW
jgi:hypothetical protein